MDLLNSLIIVSEKAANIARVIRQDEHLFQMLVEKKKSDEANPRFVEDFKTLADVLIQEMVKHDIGKQFPELSSYIRGEENNTFTNKFGDSICVEVKSDCEETKGLLRKVLNDDAHAAELLAVEVHRNIEFTEIPCDQPKENFDLDYGSLGIWIDPIDSTAEYINGGDISSGPGICLNGLGCVTVLIGAFDRRSKAPVMGVINQPFAKKIKDVWRGKCYWGATLQNFNCSSFKSSITKSKIVCISSSEDEDIKSKLKQKGFQIEEAAGAGYKILAVILGIAVAYVLSKNSTFKWDTCGPHAILRSLGGDVIIYQEALKNGDASVKYTSKEDDKCNIGGIIAYRNKTALNDVLNCLR